MRVGIITFHRAYNYGAVLQCYALQKVISSMGHEVEIIDYRQPYIEDKYSPKVSVSKVLSLLIGFHIGGVKQYLCKVRALKGRRKYFASFRYEYFRLSAPFSNLMIPQDYDCYIIGSDQMWGLHCTGGYDSVYWGDFKRPNNSKLFGYAISTNLLYHDFLTEEEIRKAVARFDGLSFREQTVRDDIEKITGYKGEVCVDPTLLSDPSIWEPMINQDWAKKRYVALYLLRCKSDSIALLREKAQEYAISHNCEVLDLTSMKYSVEDFVSIIKFSICVFTTSFHATVFSIIFNRPFYSIKLNDGSDVRYVDLLTQLELTDHLFDWKQELLPLKYEEDYVLNSKLEKYRKTSIEYLVNILK